MQFKATNSKRHGHRQLISNLYQYYLLNQTIYPCFLSPLHTVALYQHMLRLATGRLENEHFRAMTVIIGASQLVTFFGINIFDKMRG